jgi:hypothetical protein
MRSVIVFATIKHAIRPRHYSANKLSKRIVEENRSGKPPKDEYIIFQQIARVFCDYIIKRFFFNSMTSASQLLTADTCVLLPTR